MRNILQNGSNGNGIVPEGAPGCTPEAEAPMYEWMDRQREADRTVQTILENIQNNPEVRERFEKLLQEKSSPQE